MLRIIIAAMALFITVQASAQKRLLSYYEIKHGVEEPMPKPKKEASELKGAFQLMVRTNTAQQKATIYLDLEKEANPTLEIYDMDGAVLRTLNANGLETGRHQFEYLPKNISKPFILTLRSNGKLETMRVVKFNSF